MNRLLLAVAVLGLVGAGATDVSATPIVMDSANALQDPAGEVWSANVAEVGWFYVPTFSYDLTEIDTKFGGVPDNRIVTLDVFTGDPASGGQLQRSVDFLLAQELSPPAIFTGASFAPLSLVAGDEYFFGFRNVAGLGVNFYVGTGAEQLGGVRSDGSLLGTYLYPIFCPGDCANQPIVEFLGTPSASPVPEPSSLVLMLTGCAAVGCRRHRAFRRPVLLRRDPRRH